MFSILVVEDDSNLNKLLCAKLKQEGFHAVAAFDGEEALQVLDSEHIDLIITDWMMPGMDGIALVRCLREGHCDIPVLIVTAKDQMMDMEQGFLAGSDDYMVKPIHLKEMILRVNALLRRARIATEKRLIVGNTSLNYEAMTVNVNGASIELPPKEFYLLFLLLSYPNKIFTRLELLDEIWGMDSEADERNVDSHIKKLRRKFEDCADFEIVTIRGLGYKSRY